MVPYSYNYFTENPRGLYNALGHLEYTSGGWVGIVDGSYGFSFVCCVLWGVCIYMWTNLANRLENYPRFFKNPSSVIGHWLGWAKGEIWFDQMKPAYTNSSHLIHPNGISSVPCHQAGQPTASQINFTSQKSKSTLWKLSMTSDWRSSRTTLSDIFSSSQYGR